MGGAAREVDVEEAKVGNTGRSSAGRNPATLARPRLGVPKGELFSPRADRRKGKTAVRWVHGATVGPELPCSRLGIAEA